MLTSLDAPHLTLVFIATVFALALALVCLFFELERRFGKRISPRMMARFGNRPDGRRDRLTNRRDR